jgi:hypothetical protein
MVTIRNTGGPHRSSKHLFANSNETTRGSSSLDFDKRLGEAHRGPPIVPDGIEPSPQAAIGRVQFGVLDGALENADLTT